MKIFEVDNEFLDYKDTSFYKVFGDGIYHNSMDMHQNGFVEFRFRDIPKDTSTTFHEEVNRLSKEKIGIPIRSLLFATSSHMASKNITGSGSVYNVYPVSQNYKIFYAKNIVDMTTDLDVTTDDIATTTRRYVERVIYFSLKNSEEVSAREVVKVQNNIGYTLDKIVASIDDSVKIKNLDDLFTQTFIKIREYIVKRNMDFGFLDAIEDELQKIKTHYQNKAYSYVSSLIEVTNPEQLSDVSQFTEIMVYDPTGFIFKRR